MKRIKMKKYVIELDENKYKKMKKYIEQSGCSDYYDNAIAKAIPLEEELEKIKKEFEDRILLNQTVAIQIIDRQIAELKGDK